MWIVKLFKKEEKQQTGKLKSEEQDEESSNNESQVFTVPEQDVDLRYSQLNILKVKMLNLPKD